MSGNKPHKTTEGESTPRTPSEREQKARTKLEFKDMESELRKLSKQRRQMDLKEYAERRNKIIAKYAMTRKEMLDFLGISDRDEKK